MPACNQPPAQRNNSCYACGHQSGDGRMTSYDAIVIGTGRAGPPLARRLAAVGRKVAIIERGRFGGTCVNTGCTPTRRWWPVPTPPTWRAGPPSSGSPSAVRRYRLAAYPRQEGCHCRRQPDIGGTLPARTEGITVIQGEAHFVGPRDIEVNGDQLQAPQLSSMRWPANPSRYPRARPGALAYQRYCHGHRDGAGAPAGAGRELCRPGVRPDFRRFGAEVTLFEAGSRLIGREDQEISDAVKSILEAEGIQVRLGAAKCEVETADGGVAIILHRRQREGTICWWPPGGSRTPTALGLDRAGIATDQRRVHRHR